MATIAGMTGISIGPGGQRPFPSGTVSQGEAVGGNGAGIRDVQPLHACVPDRARFRIAALHDSSEHARLMEEALCRNGSIRTAGAAFSWVGSEALKSLARNCSDARPRSGPGYS